MSVNLNGCCCGCSTPLGNVLVIDATGFCEMPTVEDTHFIQGASVLRVTDIPTDIDAHDLIYLGIQVDPGIGTPPPLVSLSPAQIAMFSGWFSQGCKRLVIIGEHGHFFTQLENRNELLEAIGSEIRFNSGSELDGTGGPGGHEGTMEATNPLSAGVSGILHNGVSSVTGGNPINYTNDTEGGTIQPWAASERVGRSSVVVVADSNAVRYAALSGFDLSLSNLDFIGNLLSVSVNDA